MINIDDNWVEDKIGISNKIWINNKDKLIFKKYLFNEFSSNYGNQEKKILKYLNHINILQENKDYILLKKIEGKTISSSDLPPFLLKLIANHLREIHEIDIKNIKDLKLPNFEKTWKFLNSNSEMPKLKNEEIYFKKAMKIANDNLVIANNDIVDGNIIFNEKNKKVNIIDYEYGGLNNYLFDVASFIVKRQINKEQEKIFLDEYFKDKKFPEEEFFIARKFTSYFWSKWAFYKYLQTNDKIYLDIFNWLSER